MLTYYCTYKYSNQQFYQLIYITISLFFQSQMQNAQSPSKYRYQISRPYATSFDSLPSASDLIRNNRRSSQQSNKNIQPFNHRTNPLRKSLSVSSLIHGDPSTNHHYIDSLQRFRRDHDSKNKQQRQKERQVVLSKIQHKRNNLLNREYSIKQRENNHLRDMIEKNQKILQSHKIGIQRNNSYQNSLPVNIINQKYQDNTLGKYQKEIDDQSKVKKLVRLHHLQTRGTSGFNVINGSTSDHAETLISFDRALESKFGEKLEKFYSKFTIKAPSQEQIMHSSRRLNQIS